jgi:lysophospholipase L1-like esterase
MVQPANKRLLTEQAATEQAGNAATPLGAALSATILAQAAPRELPATRSGAKVYERHNDGYNFTASSMRKWRNALARAENGGNPARINAFGDSIVVGFGGTPDYRTAAWPTNLAKKLKDRFGEPGTGTVFLTPGAADARVVSNWPQVTQGYGVFSHMTGFASAAITPTAFTPEMQTDGFSVYVLHASGGAQVGLSVDGGAVTTFNIAAPNAGIQKFSISTTLGMHTYRVHWVAGLVFHLGMEATVSGSKVMVSRVGKGGSTVADLIAHPLDPNGHIGDSLSVAVDALSPDLSVIAFGHNEYLQQIPIATFKANMQTLISRAKVKGSVILETQVPNQSPNNTIPQSAYDQALYELADSNDIALIDTSVRWGSYATANTALLYSDGTHPANAGYLDKAAMYYDAIPFGR